MDTAKEGGKTEIALRFAVIEKERRGEELKKSEAEKDADDARFRTLRGKESHRIGLIKRRMDRAYNSGTDFRGSRNEHGRAVESRVHAQLNR